VADKKVPVQFIFQGIDNLTGPLKQVNKKLAEIQAPVKRFQGQLQSFGKLSGFNALGTSITGVGSALGDLSRIGIGLGATLVGSVAAAGYAFKAFIGDTVSANAGLSDVSKKLGLSVESLQLWHFAAEQSGASAEDLDKLFLKFSNTLSKARRGTGELTELLGKDSNFLAKLTGIKKTEDAFDFFLRTLGKVPNEANQVALAVAGMGKSGPALIQLAELSDEERKKLFDQRKEIGLLNEEQAKKFKATDDQMKALGVRLSFLKTQFVAVLLPGVEKLFLKLESFIVANKERILDFADRIAEKLPAAIDETFLAIDDLQKKFEEWAPKIKEVSDSLGGLAGVLKIVAAVVTIQVAVAMAGLIASVYELGIALATTPVGWFILGVTAMVGWAYLLKEAWDAFGGGIRGVFNGFVEWIKTTIPYGEKLIGVFTTIVDIVKWLFNHSLYTLLPATVFKIAGGLSDFTSNIRAGQSPENKVLPDMQTSSATQPAITPGAESIMRIIMENVPRGTRIQTDANKDKLPVDFSVGYALG